MQINVGIVGSKSTVTLYLNPSIPEDAKEMQNITSRNCERVGLAIARRRLDCNVFPIDIRL